MCTEIWKGMYFFAFLVKEEKHNLCHSPLVLPLNREVYCLVLGFFFLHPHKKETWKLGDKSL